MPKEIVISTIETALAPSGFWDSISSEDVDRSGQRSPRNVAGHDDDRAELSERACETEQRSGQCGRQDLG